MQVEEDGGVGVYKKGPDGKKMGKRLGMHKAKTMDEAHKKAEKQMAAILINEKSLGEKAFDELAIGAKYYDEPIYSPMMKLDQGDSRVQYGPLLGDDTTVALLTVLLVVSTATSAPYTY